MNNREAKNRNRKMGKTILVVLLIVFATRFFLFDSYTISTSQMNAVLVNGDKVFLDKTSYGIRMPITPLSIPFSFDRVLGKQSYSNSIALPYTRLLEAEVVRNDIVFYNCPTERSKPIDKRSLNIGRCIALPGDSLKYKNGIWYIDGEEYISSPDQVAQYVVEVEDSLLSIDEGLILQTLADYEIPKRKARLENSRFFMELSSYESVVYNYGISNLSHKTRLLIDSTVSYSLIVPYVGYVINLDADNSILYADCIINDSFNKVKRVGDELFREGEKLTEYIFEGDMHWMINENTLNINDSRTFGFVPFSHIIGRVSFIWYASSSRVSLFNRVIKRETK